MELDQRLAELNDEFNHRSLISKGLKSPIAYSEE